MAPKSISFFSWSIRARESGHTLLYTTIFIPLVLGSAALAFDLSAINLRVERLQSALDSITLDAAHFLPDVDLARKRAIDRINQLGSEVSDSKVEVDQFRSRVSASFVFSGNNFILPNLLAVAGFSSKNQSQVISSESELVPVDIAIVLSDGVDQRPWQEGSEKTPWPKSNAVGVASSALTQCILPPEPRYSNAVVAKVWSDSKDWLTQSCFNPVFSQFKLAAMNLSGSLLSVGTNRVAVIFTPSSNGLGETIWHAASESELRENSGGYLKVGQSPKATWTPAQDLEYELGDEACIVFADLMTAQMGDYSLDRLTKQSSSQRRCLAPVQNPMCGRPFSIGEEGRLDRECLDNASLAEAIYWRSAKRPENNFRAEPDFYSAMGVALSEVLPGENQIKLDRSTRGKLANSPGRAVILLTSSLPKLDTTNPAVQGILNTNTSMIIGFLERSNYPSSIVDSAEQDTRVREWRNFLDKRPRSNRIENAVYLASNPDELTQLVAPRIISTLRKVLLRK